MTEAKTLICGHALAEEPESDDTVWCLICAAYVAQVEEAKDVVVDARVVRAPQPLLPEGDNLERLDPPRFLNWAEVLRLRAEVKRLRACLASVLELVREAT